jgi:hypothetical protein
MRRVVRKRIRHKAEGVDLALDLNADIAVNVGSRKVSEEPQAAVPEGERRAEQPEREQGNEPEGKGR